MPLGLCTHWSLCLNCFSCPDRTPTGFSRIPPVNLSLHSSPSTPVSPSVCFVHLLDLRHISEPLSYCAPEDRTKCHHTENPCSSDTSYLSVLHEAGAQEETDVGPGLNPGSAIYRFCDLGPLLMQSLSFCIGQMGVMFPLPVAALRIF